MGGWRYSCNAVVGAFQSHSKAVLIVGAFYSSLTVYLEFGTALPFTGGELIYVSFCHSFTVTS